MGQGGSKEFEEVFQSTVSQLSEVQLAEIGTRFNELYRQAGGQRGRVIDREGFSNYFHLPIALGDRLFEAFDKKKNGSIDFEEFVCGLSVVLHGSFSSKCQLLFELFNLAGDEGISREELHSLLSSVVHSTSTILLTVTEGGTAASGEEKGTHSPPVLDTDEAINNIVDAAFNNCDISQSGKLLPLEFEYWLKRNPQILDHLLPSAGKMGGETIDHHGNTLATLLAIDDDEVSSKEATPLEEATPLDSLVLTKEDESDNVDFPYEPPSTPCDDHKNEEEERDEEDNKGENGEEREEKEGEGRDKEEKGDEKEGEEKGEEKEEEKGVEKEGKLEDKNENREEGETPQNKEIQNDMKDTIQSQDNITQNESEAVINDLFSKQSDEDKERTYSSVSASEETLKLARQLSKDLQDVLNSPSSSEDFNLPVQMEKEEESAVINQPVVNEGILSSWLPDEWVQSVLVSGRKVSPEHLTKPGLLSLTGACDPIGEILKGTFPEAERKIQLTADQVPMNHEGLITLIRNGCYHAALNLTSLFLSAHGQGIGQAGSMTMHTHKTLQMWSVRLTLLCHLSRYNEAKEEFEAFRDLEQPDLYYQYNKHNYPETIGSMVPYSMRLLHVQLPLYTGGNQQIALNRICILQHKTVSVLNHIKQRKTLPMANDFSLSPQDQLIAEEVWVKRLAHVKCILANCLLSMKDYHLVQQVLTELMSLLPDQSSKILSSQGKLCLLYGNVGGAERYFSQAISGDDSSSLAHSQRGLINIYHNQWTKAENDFKMASACESSSPMTSVYNSAMCGLYQGNLHKTITQIEELIKESPNSLQVALFKVLFSLYELESSQYQAKKLSWLPLLGYHAPEGFSLMSVGMIT